MGKISLIDLRGCFSEVLAIRRATLGVFEACRRSFFLGRQNSRTGAGGPSKAVTGWRAVARQTALRPGAPLCWFGCDQLERLGCFCAGLAVTRWSDLVAFCLLERYPFAPSLPFRFGRRRRRSPR